MITKMRIDELLVEYELVENLKLAQAQIMSGNVLVNDQVVDKIGVIINLQKPHKIRFRKEKLKYVSRAGYKLEKALTHFNIDLNEMDVLDVGSSTGGFTDCALQNGAKEVYALDVGTNQLDYILRTNNKVKVYEQTNFRTIDQHFFDIKFDIITMDVSFISIKALLYNVKQLLKEDGIFICLLKPQFEATKDEVNLSKGIIHDVNIHARIFNEVQVALNSLQLYINDYTVSPIKGKYGNTEYLLKITSSENEYSDFKL